MAVVNLNQAQAQASPYFWRFNTLTKKNSIVVVTRRQRGAMREMQAANVAAALVKVNAYETYLSNAGVAVTEF